jgi:enamine deaminase RidA (YjgF/YER057c/UK114 family)
MDEVTKKVMVIPADNPMFAGSQKGYEHYGYSPAVRAGNLLFIAGEVGFRPDGSIPETVAEQTEVALERTKEILRLQGLTMGDLVEVVSYHVDLRQTINEFMPVKARYTERPFPAWSIIGVEALGLPELKIEIRSVAAFPEGR